MLSMRMTALAVALAMVVSGCSHQPVITTPPVRNLTAEEMTATKAFAAAIYAEWSRRHPNPGMDPANLEIQVGIHDVDYVPHPPMRVTVRIARGADLADVISTITTAYQGSKVNDVDISVTRMVSDSKVITRLEFSRTASEARPKQWYRDDWF